MPRFWTVNNEGKPVERYQWPAEYVTPTCDINPALRAWRVVAIKDREGFMQIQPQCSRDEVRFFRDCAGHALRLQRACTLMLPWFGLPDSGQKVERPLLWPLELSGELDEISYRIVLRFG